METSDVDASNWEPEISKSTILTIVYFWHEQCPWCFRFNPILNEVAEEYRGKLKFAKLNVLASPSNQEIANDFGVMSTPTLLFLCGGKTSGTGCRPNVQGRLGKGTKRHACKIQRLSESEHRTEASLHRVKTS